MAGNSNKPEPSIKQWIYALIALVVVFAGGGAGLSQLGMASSGEGQAGTALESKQMDVRQYEFRNEKLLQEHYKKHGAEMGFPSAYEYQKAAAQVAANPAALHKLEAEDGDDVYYLEESNEFVIISTDGYIRTYFKPDSGKAYYDRQ